MRRKGNPAWLSGPRAGRGPWWASLVVCALLAASGLVVASNQAAQAATVWTYIGATGGAAVQALALDPTNPNCLYAGTYDQGLFTTADGGTIWSNPLAAGVAAIAIDPQNPATVYAGTWQQGAYRSLNAGVDWSPINTGLAANGVQALLVISGTTPALYAGTEMGVFASSNRGDGWQGASSGFTGRTVYALAHSGSTLFAGTDLGVFKSIGGGASWAPANNGLTANAVYCLAAAGGTVYAGTERGVFRSADAGATWRSASQGLPAGPVRALAAVSARPEVVFAATPQGVYGSAAGGEGWVKLSAELSGAAQEANALALYGESAPWTVYVGTGAGVYARTVSAGDLARWVFLPALLR